MPEAEIPMRLTTVRLPVELAEDLATLALVEGITSSQAIREAIEGHIRSRRADARFQERLRKRVEAHSILLERLAQS